MHMRSKIHSVYLHMHVLVPRPNIQLVTVCVCDAHQ